ncbi:MAG TPA: YeeE/YedE family protein [Hyphomicrobiaceae bacterium]|nr:YeeE/YedE family protein [Hyphomicrobiaceae bacterium]
MSALAEVLQANPSLWLAIGGGVIGLLFGYLIYRTNFCTMGSVSDFVNFGDWRRFRAWILAAAVALAGTQALALSGSIPLSKTMYLTPSFNWFGYVVGGLMFGFGMVFAGGCASRNLARVGGGDLRALVTLIVMGMFGYMAIGGIIGPVRNWIEQLTSVPLGGLGVKSQGLGDILGSVSGLGAHSGSIVVAAILLVGALIYCFKSEEFRSSPVHVFSGIGVGVLVVAGWLLTGLAYDELAERTTSPISLTYVRPTGDTLEWLQRFTAGMMPGFGVATVLGALLGAFIAAISMGRFKVTTFATPSETVRTLFGAALMGVGGVMALGCTVGQSITGVSTLALGSFITFAAIVIGGVKGMKVLENMLMNEV